VIHPWHDLPAGKHPPDEITAIIEIPGGSRNKYELDKESGLFRLDRVLYSAVTIRGTTGSSRARCPKTAIRATCSC